MKYADELRSKVAELVQERAALKAEAEAITALETRGAEDDARLTEILDRNAECITEIDAAEKRAAELDALEVERKAAPVFHVKPSDSDVYDLEVRSSSPQDLIERARTAIERNGEGSFTDEQREAVTAKLSQRTKHAAGVAQYVIETGSPEYMAEFERYVQTNGRAFGPLLERAAMSLTTANGGAMVPYILDPSVILTNNGATNPIRQIARVETITGSNEWRGVTSAGVNAEWLGEGSQAADASPTFTQPAIPTFKGAAYLFGSYEVLADSGFASQVQGLIADAKNRLEATAFITGGGTNTPEGVVTAVAAVTTSRVTATTNNLFGSVDVYKLASALPPRYRANSTWLAELNIINSIRQFDTAGGSSFWATLGMDQPERLLGRPIY